MMAKWMGALLCTAGMLAAQNATFQTGTRLVLVDVTVRTNDGPVAGLTKEDFKIKDKGKEREIAVFEITPTGVTGDAPTPLPPQIATNRLNSLGEVQQSATIILYDRINTEATNQAFVGNQILDTLAGLGDNERVGFYSLGFNLLMVHDYNEPAAALARVARKMREDKASPDGLSPEDQALYRRLSEGITPMQQLANQARVNVTYPAFRSIGRHLAGVPGAKNLLWITSSFPLTYGNAPERRRNDEAEVQAFTNALTDARIALYPVDPGGTGATLATAYEESTEGQLLEREGTPVMRTNQASSLTGFQTMQRLSDRTGGRPYRNANDIGPALREGIDLAAVTYTLGFVPDEKGLDDKAHKVEVEFTKSDRTKDAKASYRTEYMAYKPGSELAQQAIPPMPELVSDSVASSAIQLMAVANPDPADPTKQKVDVRVTVSDIDFERQGDNYIGSFDLAMVAEGAKDGAMQTFPLEFSQEQYQQASQGGLDLSNSIPVPADTGRIRVVLQDKLSGKSGSVHVPYSKTPVQ